MAIGLSIFLIVVSLAVFIFVPYFIGRIFFRKVTMGDSAFETWALGILGFLLGISVLALVGMTCYGLFTGFMSLVHSWGIR